MIMPLTQAQKTVIKQFLDRPVEVGRLLGFRDLREFHNEWLKLMIQGGETDEDTLNASRGAYKTTCLSIAISIIMILFPNKNIIFTRKKDENVTEVIKQVSKILEHELMRRAVWTLYECELIKVEDNNHSITTNLMSGAKGCDQLYGAGVNTSLTGFHCDILMTDDIVTLQDRISQAERERTKISYMELLNIKNRDGRIFNTGTPWAKDDAISIMANKHIYDCYSMPELYTQEKLNELRSKMSPSLFSANYELKHIADEESLFSSPKFIKEQELWAETTNKSRPKNIFHNGVGHIDASYSGKDGTAYTIIQKLEDGRFLVFGKRWECHVDRCINEIVQWQNHYKVGTIFLETNADKGYLAKDLRKRGLITKEYHESMQKHIKIATYLKSEWDNIYFLENTCHEYLNEILDYTEGATHEDSADSLASIIREKYGKSGWLI